MIPADETSRKVEKGRTLANDAVQADIEHAIDNDFGRRPIAINNIGKVSIASPIEQLVGNNLLLAVIDGP